MHTEQGRHRTTAQQEIHDAFWNFVAEAVHPIGSGAVTVMTLMHMSFVQGGNVVIHTKEDAYKMLICVCMNSVMLITSASTFMQYMRYQRISEKYKKDRNWHP